MRNRQMNRAVWFAGAAALVVGACTSSASTAGSSRPSAAASADGSPSTADCTSSSTGAAYAMATCAFHSPSLAGNLIYDEPVVNVYILTPSDYETSGKRYPVVYVLAGYTDPATGLAYAVGGAPVPAADAVLPIFVVVSGVNSFGGGFYVNSPVTGNWEDAIAVDLVGYVDANYRTLAQRQSRGIAGHSMGGYGSISLAMRRADVFGALYSMSPGLFDANGMQDTFGTLALTGMAADLGAAAAGKTGADLADALKLAAAGASQFGVAYGLAFAGNPSSPILMDFPFSSKDGQSVRDDKAWARWEGGFGNLAAKVKQYATALKSLSGIVIDYGTADENAWIPRGSHYFVGLLKDAGIAAEERTYDGGHNEQIDARLLSQVLPFMQQKLATS
jgi:S-formylglutathione hydrolase FrmB